MDGWWMDTSMAFYLFWSEIINRAHAVCVRRILNPLGTEIQLSKKGMTVGCQNPDSSQGRGNEAGGITWGTNLQHLAHLMPLLPFMVYKKEIAELGERGDSTGESAGQQSTGVCMCAGVCACGSLTNTQNGKCVAHCFPCPGSWACSVFLQQWVAIQIHNWHRDETVGNSQRCCEVFTTLILNDLSARCIAISGCKEIEIHTRRQKWSNICQITQWGVNIRVQAIEKESYLHKWRLKSSM